MELTGVKQTFDYGSINDSHKEAVEEAANLAREMGHHLFAEYLVRKFNVVEPKRFDLDDSLFFQLCKENDIRPFLQGHRIEKTDGEEIHYPVLSITEDVRTLDALVEKLMKYSE